MDHRVIMDPISSPCQAYENYVKEVRSGSDAHGLSEVMEAKNKAGQIYVNIRNATINFLECVSVP